MCMGGQPFCYLFYRKYETERFIGVKESLKVGIIGIGCLDLISNVHAILSTHHSSSLINRKVSV